MAEVTRHEPGTPSWVDLGSPDPAASAVFYSALLGWEATEPGDPETTGGYQMFTLRGKNVAGLGPLQPGQPPSWTAYVTVEDADTAAKVAADAGGQVLAGPFDVLDAGRMAVLMDAEGAAVSIWQPRAHIGAELVNEPGTLCWTELMSRDVGGAKAFYGKLFGWGAQDNAYEGGSYTEWQVNGRTVGGMIPMPEQMPPEMPPLWMVYFAVDNTDAAVAKAQNAGATIMMQPFEVPPGRIAVLTDPQGATFSIIKLNEAPPG